MIQYMYIYIYICLSIYRFINLSIYLSRYIYASSQRRVISLFSLLSLFSLSLSLPLTVHASTTSERHRKRLYLNGTHSLIDVLTLFISSVTGLHCHVGACAGVYWCVLVRIGVYYTNTHQYTPIHTNTRRYTPWCLVSLLCGRRFESSRWRFRRVAFVLVHFLLLCRSRVSTFSFGSLV